MFLANISHFNNGVQSEIKSLRNFPLNIIPAKDYLKIAYRLPVKITAKLTLYNTIGGVVYQAKSDNGYFLIETKKLSTGIYIIKFNANEYKATKKLVIH
uniref:T9SS type A sorting domain-containing protein n=1 Tax=candidate division WOR-3 bacterium TaxID=2052148 RepID=A0A7V6CN92_UNCW3